MTGHRRGMVAALAAAAVLLMAGCHGSSAQGFASASRPQAEDTPSETPSPSTPERAADTPRRTPTPTSTPTPAPTSTHPPGTAAVALDGLREAEPGPPPAYQRKAFGPVPPELGTRCGIRERVLARDLDDTSTGDDGCIVSSGVLSDDPYGGAQVWYQLDAGSRVQVDHVVALEDAWRRGAAEWSGKRRAAFAHDPANLLAVDLQIAQDKGGASAADWLPPNEDYRCRYVARQIAVKSAYDLAVTSAERSRMRAVLAECPDQAVARAERRR